MIISTAIAFALLCNTSLISASNIPLQEKIKAYKEYKKKAEDKDFQLKSSPVERTEISKGKIQNPKFFEKYYITYGITEDNNYRGKKKFYTQQDGEWYIEDYTKNTLKPKVSKLEEAPYPVTLTLNTLPKEDLEKIILICEFEDGDIDIRLHPDVNDDKELAERIYKKLKEADEINDEKKPEAKMEPIIPTKNQRLPFVSSRIAEDGNGEIDHILAPYCINGSYFDSDPYNDRIQVAFKYRLVTKKDLKGKTSKERIGSWMWDKPVEILISYCENPGPDITFYDLGKVVDGKVIDEKPDGIFDKYKFLY